MSQPDISSSLRRILHHPENSSSFDPVFWSVPAFLFTLLVIVMVWCICGGAEKISNYLTREAAGLSDAEYLARVRQRRERKAEKSKETPEQRMANLKNTFQRNKVLMVVGCNDFIEESILEIVENESIIEEKENELASVPEKLEAPAVDCSSSIENAGARIDEEDGTAVIASPGEECETFVQDENESPADIEHGARTDDETDRTALTEETETSSALFAVELGSPDAIPAALEEDVAAASLESSEDNNSTIIQEDQTFAMNAVETGAPGYIKLRLASGKKRTVPNCCAVCLCTYEEGETVVWSSNRACKHAFHEECVMEWLIKMQDGTPCPCCRQEFTDVDTHKIRQKKVDSRASFDVSVIRL